MSSRAYISIMLCTAVFLTTACSNIQNRSKQNNTNKGATIKLTVEARSTTQETTTSDTLDKNIEATLNKSLTQVLISGSAKKELFSDTAYANASETFLDHTKSRSNSASVSYYFLNPANNDGPVIVADVKQDVTDNNKKSIYSGTIYLTPDGIIIGYNFEKLSGE